MRVLGVLPVVSTPFAFYAAYRQFAEEAGAVPQREAVGTSGRIIGAMIMLGFFLSRPVAFECIPMGEDGLAESQTINNRVSISGSGRNQWILDARKIRVRTAGPWHFNDDHYFDVFVGYARSD